MKHYEQVKEYLFHIICLSHSSSWKVVRKGIQAGNEEEIIE